MKKLLALAIAVALATPALAQGWVRGARVLIYSSSDGYWYPAVFGAMEGNLVTAFYSSTNGRVSVPRNLAALFNWTRGTRISCKFSDGAWYGATITGGVYSGGVIDIVWNDDGTRQRSNLRYCRTGRGL